MTFEIIKGKTFRIQSVVYTDEGITPANLAGATAKFLVKKNVADPDSSALINKTIGQGITIISESEGLLETLITATDTNNLSYKVLYFELVVKLANGNIIRNGIDEFVIEKNIVNTLI
jgi:hypothetical protein